ncbi:unnamed protein product [Mesocestoides corti]|uniref:Phosphatidylinositol-4,5-bisphosphate 4-phosphatase n=1 Tax=Mesocestoides corti TaxID=53468 RepID=A0A0R3ULH4_MESCO|nr:unnamed protein product [Mesocestoides corti]
MATPIKGPPPGKQYVRCQCNCLLICKASTTRVGCPRPQCQRVITLSNPAVTNYNTNTESDSGLGTGGTFPSRGGLRVTCGNCHRPFSIPSPPPYQPTACDAAFTNRLVSCLSNGSASNVSLLIAARCPQCRRVTSVGQAYARTRWVGYLLLCVLFAVIAIGVTAGTVSTAKTQHGLYFLWSILYLLVLIFAIRFVKFFRMPVSALELAVVRA